MGKAVIILLAILSFFVAAGLVARILQYMGII